ncbi:MAG: hypothetical protein WC787_02375 [Patescibacteria group bacterium]|jgi:hypothetical protein
MKKLIAPLIVCALVVGGGAFYGGTVYAKKTMPTGNAAFANFQGGARPTGAAGQNGQFRMQLGGATAGEVVSKDDTSLTVKLRDGGSKIVFFSASTTVAKMETASMTDIAQGSNVTVMGSANQDGSVTANAIQLR